MSGPISITTLNSIPVRDRQNKKLVIEIPLEKFGDEIPDFGEMMTHILRDWRDGRYPFDVEMIKDGVYRCMKWAMYEMVCEEMQNKYGNEMVAREDGSGSTARWVLEADKVKIEYPYICEDLKARVE